MLHKDFIQMIRLVFLKCSALSEFIALFIIWAVKGMSGLQLMFEAITDVVL